MKGRFSGVDQASSEEKVNKIRILGRKIISIGELKQNYSYGEIAMASSKRLGLSGKCVYCGRAYTLAGIGRHLISCSRRREELSKGKTRKAFIIRVKGRGVTGYTYWMVVEANPKLKLSDLDAFLRKQWVECCGHLSQFTINGEYYVDERAREPGEKSMEDRLERVLEEGTEFIYEYDFGTTTVLELKVLKVDEGTEKSIKILAINEAPQITCEACGSSKRMKLRRLTRLFLR